MWGGKDDGGKIVGVEMERMMFGRMIFYLVKSVVGDEVMDAEILGWLLLFPPWSVLFRYVEWDLPDELEGSAAIFNSLLHFHSYTRKLDQRLFSF